MTDKQIIIDCVDVSNFCLVCYYDNKTNELVRIEQYNDNDSSMYSDIESYEYGYNAKIIKPEEIIKQLKRKEQECEELKQALKEIKEIANHCMEQDLCTFCNYNDKCYKGFEDEALSYDVCKLILEKISEVIDD